MSGTNFGLSGTVYVDRAGHNVPSEASCTIVTYSDSSITCRMPIGQGRVSLIVTVAEQDSSVFPVFYDPPLITSFTPSHGGTRGGDLLALTGVNFGAGGSVEMGGGSDWKECRIEQYSNVLIVCRTPAGYGTGKQLRMSVQGQTAISTQFFGYDPPAVSGVLPNPVDPRGGDVVTVQGENFGPSQTASSVSLLGFDSATSNLTGTALACGSARWMPFGGATSEPVITCRMPATTVGQYLVAVNVAERNSTTVLVSPVVLVAQCLQNFYGQVGEMCMACPAGAQCPGGLMEPTALIEWWRISRASFRLCAPRHACVGNNTCRDGFTGSFCASCADGFYRLSADCKQCPDTAAQSLILIVLGCVILVLIVYWITSKDLRLASVNVGVDFMQVTALGASFGLAWPAYIQTMFDMSSVSNLNFEVAAPECTIRWTYATKWSVVETMPFMMAAIMLVIRLSFVVSYYVRLTAWQIAVPRSVRVGAAKPAGGAAESHAS